MARSPHGTVRCSGGAVTREACLVRGFPAARLEGIAGIEGVYAKRENGHPRVTVLVGDFCGEVRTQVYCGVNALRKRFDGPDVKAE